MLPHSPNQLVNRLVEEALDLPVAERDSFVRDHESWGDDLAAQAMQLLALSNSINGFLERPPIPTSGIRPGDVLDGRFRILKELGAGGTAKVFLAEDPDGGSVALKVIGRFLAGEPVSMALRAIRHPNLCPIFDIFNFDHERRLLKAIAMKYVPGETLASRLSRGPLDSREMMPVALGIASGIDALHTEGIVHCDLKPENVLLAENDKGRPTPVIVDFGSAVRISGEPEKSVSGSPQYMAPEQFRHHPPSTASDIFAFGLILYEMISGSRPFPDEDLIAGAIRRSVEDAPRLRSAAPRAPAAWDHAIALALSRRPAERPHSAAAVVKLMGAIDKTNRWCRHRMPGLSCGDAQYGLIFPKWFRGGTGAGRRRPAFCR
jgi:eukaryotic-like serine/threonine-protein kinase